MQTSLTAATFRPRNCIQAGKPGRCAIQWSKKANKRRADAMKPTTAPTAAATTKTNAPDTSRLTAAVHAPVC